MASDKRFRWDEWWGASSRRTRLGLVVLVIVAILAIGSIVSLNKNSGVDWENYPPSLKVRIDQLTRDTDCAGLDREVARARAGNAEQRRETGNDNEDVIAYIRKQQNYVGCD